MIQMNLDTIGAKAPETWLVTIVFEGDCEGYLRLIISKTKSQNAFYDLWMNIALMVVIMLVIEMYPFIWSYSHYY